RRVRAQGQLLRLPEAVRRCRRGGVEADAVFRKTAGLDPHAAALAGHGVHMWLDEPILIAARHYCAIKISHDTGSGGAGPCPTGARRNSKSRCKTSSLRK